MLTQWFSSSLMAMSPSGSSFDVVVEFARWDGAGAFALDLGGARGAQAQVKIGGRDGQTVVAGLKQKIGQDGDRGLALDHALRGREFPQQLELADTDFHRRTLHRSRRFGSHKVPPRHVAILPDALYYCFSLYQIKRI